MKYLTAFGRFAVRKEVKAQWDSRYVNPVAPFLFGTTAAIRKEVNHGQKGKRTKGDWMMDAHPVNSYKNRVIEKDLEEWT